MFIRWLFVPLQRFEVKVLFENSSKLHALIPFEHGLKPIQKCTFQKIWYFLRCFHFYVPYDHDFFIDVFYEVKKMFLIPITCSYDDLSYLYSNLKWKSYSKQLKIACFDTFWTSSKTYSKVHFSKKIDASYDVSTFTCRMTIILSLTYSLKSRECFRYLLHVLTMNFLTPKSGDIIGKINFF